MSVRQVAFEHIRRCHICLERKCEANPANENSSFIFTICLKSVPLYHFKLVYVIHHFKHGEIGRSNLDRHFLLTLKISRSVPLNSYPKF